MSTHTHTDTPILKTMVYTDTFNFNPTSQGAFQFFSLSIFVTTFSNNGKARSRFLQNIYTYAKAQDTQKIVPELPIYSTVKSKPIYWSSKFLKMFLKAKYV